MLRDERLVGILTEAQCPSGQDVHLDLARLDPAAHRYRRHPKIGGHLGHGHQVRRTRPVVERSMMLKAA
ncbi:MAG: hypothetical protein WCG47_15015 [Dermatophilaceae bacterium]